METNPRPVGLTKDAGYQVGARKTMPISLEEAWQRVISPLCSSPCAPWRGNRPPPGCERIGT